MWVRVWVRVWMRVWMRVRMRVRRGVVRGMPCVDARAPLCGPERSARAARRWPSAWTPRRPRRAWRGPPPGSRRPPPASHAAPRAWRRARGACPRRKGRLGASSSSRIRRRCAAAARGAGGGVVGGSGGGSGGGGAGGSVGGSVGVRYRETGHRATCGDGARLRVELGPRVGVQVRLQVVLRHGREQPRVDPLALAPGFLSAECALVAVLQWRAHRRSVWVRSVWRNAYAWASAWRVSPPPRC